MRRVFVQNVVCFSLVSFSIYIRCFVQTIIDSSNFHCGFPRVSSRQAWLYLTHLKAGCTIISFTAVWAIWTPYEQFRTYFKNKTLTDVFDHNFNKCIRVDRLTKFLRSNIHNEISMCFNWPQIHYSSTLFNSKIQLLPITAAFVYVRTPKYLPLLWSVF